MQDTIVDPVEDHKQSDDEMESDDDDFDDSDDDSFDSSADIERELSVTNTQLFKIERKIQQGTDLSKRERRLLQNRKSALKCRLKKQQELDKMKRQVDKLQGENRELKEKVSVSVIEIFLCQISAITALLQCKQDENSSLQKKYSDLQMQQTLIIASYLSQINNGAGGASNARSGFGGNNNNALAQQLTGGFQNNGGS